MKREMSDRLIKAVDDYKATKSEEAFNIIYEESKKYLYVCIYNRLKGNDNALELTEDILVETMLTISEKINQNRETGAFLGWAAMVARSECTKYFDKASTKHEVLRTAEEEAAHELAVADEAFIPENLVDSKEKIRLIKEIIDNELNDKEYKCVYYYYYEDMKQFEIAEFLGMNENSVKTNLSRAKAKIKDAVLRMEKEKGTKLYSFAPFMLLLFRQEIADAVVPEAWKQMVMQKRALQVNAQTATQNGSSSTKAGASQQGTSASMPGKAVATSVKTKIIAGIAGVAVVGGVIGGGYALTHNQEPQAVIEQNANEELTWEDAYKPYLLGTDEVSKFDLKDLDGDDIPELIAESDNGDFFLFRSDNGVLSSVVTWNIETEKAERPIYESMNIRYGYGSANNEIIRLDNGTVVLPDGSKELPECWIYQYNDTKLRPNLSYVLYLVNESRGITNENCSYAVTIGEEKNHFELDEGPTHVQEVESQFQEISFKEITEQNVNDMFEEFETEDK